MPAWLLVICKTDLYGNVVQQVTGMKVYHTKDDDAIMETNLEWGSDIRVRVGVRLKLGPFVIYVPLEVEDVQVIPCNRIMRLFIYDAYIHRILRSELYDSYIDLTLSLHLI
jgi:hypothetical protein